MVTEREIERDVRRLPQAWLRTSLVSVGVVVSGWLFLGGSPAEAAAVPGEPIGVVGSASRHMATLTAADAAAARQPSGVEVVEQTATHAADKVRERGQQRSQRLDQVSTGHQNRSRFDEIVDGADLAVGSLVEQSGHAIDGIGPDVTPCRRECLPAQCRRECLPAHALGAVADTVQPVFEPVDEVTSATPGEPGVLSLTDRDAPGSSVEAPRATTGASSNSRPESRAATVDSARPSSWSSPSTPSRGSTVGGSGPPGTLVSGVPPGMCDGAASSASGHGSMDCGHNVAPDVSPLVVVPRLVMSPLVTSRSTGHPERATRPSVSPD